MSETLHVLQVEDSESDAEFMVVLLEKAGHEVHSERVEDAGEMLAALGRQEWDVIISDHHLPLFSAPAALQVVQETGQDIPFIVVSGNIGEDVAVAMMKAGAHDYILKNNLARLAPAVEREIREAGGRRERRRAEEALRQSQEQYRTLFNTLIEGFCLVEVLFDTDGRAIDYRFLEINPAFEKQTGLHGAQGKLIRDLVPDHEAHWFEMFGRVALTGKPVRFESEAKALHRWYEVVAHRVGGPESRKVAILFNDVSERKRAEEALRESEATNRALLETAAQAIVAAGVDGAMVLANRMAGDMFGYVRNELLGKPLEMLVPPRLRESHVTHRAGFRSNPRTRLPGSGLELAGLRKDGSEFPIEVSLSRVETSRGPLAVAFVTDITKRKEAEAALRNSERELRALAGRLLTAQEDERRRIARDLHDDVTQRLALISIEVGKVAAGTDISVEETRTRLRSLQSQVVQVSKDVRRVSHGLHPSVIEDFGLSTALEEFCEEFGCAHGINVRFDGLVDDTGLNLDAASCLYRIAQESVHNAARHARSTEVRVALIRNGGKMQLQVSDNGTGFSAELGPAKNGLGIASMKERVRMLHGTLSIASLPGQGAKVTASVPLSGGGRETSADSAR